MDSKRAFATGLVALLLLAAPARSQTPTAITYAIIELPLLPEPHPTGMAYAINDAGQAVGVADSHGVLWEGSQVIDLGTLPSGYTALPVAINNAGQLVGTASEFLVVSAAGKFGSFGVGRAFLWVNHSAIELPIELPSFPDADWSNARDINDAGQVVGFAQSALTNATGDNVPDQHAVLWESGHILDLGGLGLDRYEAHSINDAGQIVGWAWAPDRTAAVLWDPSG